MLGRPPTTPVLPGPVPVPTHGAGADLANPRSLPVKVEDAHLTLAWLAAAAADPPLYSPNLRLLGMTYQSFSDQCKSEFFHNFAIILKKTRREEGRSS